MLHASHYLLGTRLRVWGPSSFQLLLGDGGAQRGADLGERVADLGGQGTHGSGGAKGNESNDKSVLDKVLAIFAGQEVVELDGSHQNPILHLSSISALKILLQRYAELAYVLATRVPNSTRILYQ